MTHDEGNKRIHEWLGKCWHDIRYHELNGKMHEVCLKCELDNIKFLYPKNPQYHKDLNAWGPVWERLINRDAHLRYVEVFSEIECIDWTATIHVQRLYYGLFGLFSATPQQHYQAMQKLLDELEKSQ